MIVKVQTNLNEPAGKRVLIYNEDRSVQFEGDVTAEAADRPWESSGCS